MGVQATPNEAGQRDMAQAVMRGAEPDPGELDAERMSRLIDLLDATARQIDEI